MSTQHSGKGGDASKKNTVTESTDSNDQRKSEKNP